MTSENNMKSSHCLYWYSFTVYFFIVVHIRKRKPWYKSSMVNDLSINSQVLVACPQIASEPTD